MRAAGRHGGVRAHEDAQPLLSLPLAAGGLPHPHSLPHSPAMLTCAHPRRRRRAAKRAITYSSAEDRKSDDVSEEESPKPAV